ncbi:MAG: glycosyltransferase family 4 protein [Rhodothalassiaceae bacterium]
MWTATPKSSMAIVTSQAFSLYNFRDKLIRALVDQGIKVYALAPDYDSRSREAVRALGAEPVDISLERTGMRPLRDLLDMFRLVRTLRHFRPDATFAYFIKPVTYGSLAAWLAGVPRRYALVPGLGYVFIEDGAPSGWKRSLLRRIASVLYRIAFRICDRVFFQNDEDAAYFISKGSLTLDKVVRVNGTGVDLEHFLPAPSVQQPVTFLLMGRLLRQKGVCEFVAAARQIGACHPDTRFLLLGDLDPNPTSLTRAEIEDWVRDGILEWPGHIDDVRPWIAKASVYVLPSYREGVPRSTQEAMAMGRPVITTDAVGCRETVEDGVNGFLVPVRDAAALAAAMLRFIENPALIDSMGRESRRLAEEKFDVRKINAIMLEAMGIRSQGDSFPHARD